MARSGYSDLRVRGQYVGNRATTVRNQGEEFVTHQGEMKTTIYRDAGKLHAAFPVKNECGEPAAFTPGSVPYRGWPFSIPTGDGALYLAAEILWPEIWPAAHNRELQKADGTYSEGWKNDATGFSYED